MSDEEVMGWLSAKDARNFRSARAMPEGAYMAGVLRALAETRRALAALRDAVRMTYVLTDDVARAALTADPLLATMPRPKGEP